MSAILQASNLKKTYPQNRQPVLNDVSLKMTRGEFVAVMGPSGSGKSTLLFALSGMEPLDEGSVHLMGQDISQMKEDQRANIRLSHMGFVFQQPAMMKTLTLLDNILLPAMQGNAKQRRQAREAADQLMQETGIAALGTRDVTQVSGGELQRAGICRALINRPDILFGDEPTGALNSKTSGEVMDLFSQINKRGVTVLLVTHDAKVAQRADRVLFMKDGRIHREAELKQVSEEEKQALIQRAMQEVGI